MPGFRDSAGSAEQFDWQSLRQRIDMIAGSMQETLSDAVIDQLLQERAGRFSRAVDDEGQDHTEAIVFEEEGARYAIPLDMLSEIRPVQRMTVLPGVPAGIMGVINVRGRIVAIYSLAGRQADYSREAGGYALIGQGKTGHVALHADNIVGAERMSASEIKPPPISIAGKDYITGIGRDGVVFLDFEKFLVYQSGVKA